MKKEIKNLLHKITLAERLMSYYSHDLIDKNTTSAHDTIRRMLAARTRLVLQRSPSQHFASHFFPLA